MFLWKFVSYLRDTFVSHAPQDSSDSGSFAWPDIEYKLEENIQVFRGKVTRVDVDNGLINGDIYFSFKDLFGISRAQVGDFVEVEAKRHNREGGWIAAKVTMVTKTWDDEIADDVVKKLSFVGKVTKITPEGGLINDKIAFSPDSVSVDYLPMVGDWVKVDLDADKNKSPGKKDAGDEICVTHNATQVQALRLWTFQGSVSAAMSDHGYIDEVVYYPAYACLNGYKPKKLDLVSVTAVENNCNTCSWRAISVAPCSNNRRTKNVIPRSGKEVTNTAWVVRGQFPKRNTSNKFLPNKLPHYPVPETLKTHVLDGDELTALYPALAQLMTLSKYDQKFTILLHLEEIQMGLNMEEFDMFNVCLRKHRSFLALPVPGLAEGRPSVLIGDQILLSDPTDPDGIKYEGIVHEVKRDEVLLKFNEIFHTRYSGEDYNVSFTFNRTTIRRCHQSVHLALKHLGPAVLFPTTLEMKKTQIDLVSALHHNSQTQHRYSSRKSVHTPKIKIQLNDMKDSSIDASGENSENVLGKSCPLSSEILGSIKFVNPTLNNEQKTAIVEILLGQGRPIPYIIFGPPGTGKTITVVEAILQVWKRLPSSRVIVCAPSNSAADLLVERIDATGLVKTSDMIRLNAFQRSRHVLPTTVSKYSVVDENLEAIARYRIVVATCATSGWLYTIGLQPGHFTHVFVDECGQATEPESLIPIGLVGAADGQIVLAGDPKQLGPVIMSSKAKLYGLELSFLERLMDRPLYECDEKYSTHGGFNPHLVTMLVKNYRSHQAILKLSSQLFYFGELQPQAEPGLTQLFCQWKLLPKFNFPIIFHGTRGNDLKENDSPSWCNAVETLTVVQYVQSLYQSAEFKITKEDIGIITPYRKQVEKIKHLIDKLNIALPKVGSVEEFQGQERKIIIISTVRSNENIVGCDVRHTLGFLCSPKRFNVAITRAQALLILVGNPHILQQDENWRLLIKYCIENGGYTGCEAPIFQEETAF